jgi:hypothetical protein
MAERPRLSPITETDRPVVERLWQLYSHDMSEVRGTLPNAEGMFKRAACRRTSTTRTRAAT